MSGTARAALQSPFGLVADLGAAVAAEIGISDAQIAAWLGYLAGKLVGTDQARAAVVRGRRELASRRVNPERYRGARSAVPAPPTTRKARTPAPAPVVRVAEAAAPADPEPEPEPVPAHVVEAPGPEPEPVVVPAPDPVPEVAEPVDAKAAKAAADEAAIARAVAAVLAASVKSAPAAPG